MNFSERPPSQQWAALKYRGETLAEVWFKPQGEPFSLTFRISQESFRIPGIAPRLTAENLLKAVAIAADEVESWRSNGSDPELSQPLQPPPPDITCLEVHVRLKPPPPVADESGESDFPAAKWQHLDARWKAILGLEAVIDTLRLGMQSLRAELEAATRKTLATEERMNALNADVTWWNREKSRVHFTLPKVNEFIHRATWAVGAPERKKLEEIHKNHVEPRIPFPEMGRLPDHLESLLKERQVLQAQGQTVHQECRSTLADIEGALRNLLSNAAANARRKIEEHRPKGKFFKSVRRWTGAEG